MKKLKQLSLFELIPYSFLILLGLWGLVYCILGMVCNFISIKSGLYTANKTLTNTFGIGFLVSGLIILGVAVLLAVIILLINAKKSDRDYEKAQRRAARLKKRPEVVDVPVEKSEVSE